MPESDHYLGVKNFVDTSFSESIKPRSDQSLPISQITARSGPYASGTWSRPDLALIHLWKYKYSPTLIMDLYGFEVKTFTGCDIPGIHEALAHTRIVHYAYLVWEFPEENGADSKFSNIRENCAAYGIGLITFSDSMKTDSYKVHLLAERKDPSPDAIDDFIESRFDNHQKDLLKKWLPNLV